MQQVNGIPVYSTDPSLIYTGLEKEPTWFSAQGGVYKCLDSSNKQVAIKKYLVEEDNPYGDMFVMPKELVENEIYSMTKCVHPNILKLYSVHLYQEFVYLVMPLCTGGSLQQYVFEHHLTVGQLVHIITSIASGLAKVHVNGYIHRDIKCDNIFLDEENNNIVIGDFGVVSILPAADSSVEEAGVVLFWSPELVKKKIVNHKVDIWALGIVILEVLNGGKAPYEDEKLDEEEIKERILQAGRPEYPPNLPPLLVDLLDHCLDPDPQQRYSANNVLQHPFLKKFKPELLFPATKLEQEVCSSSESEPSESEPSESEPSYSEPSDSMLKLINHKQDIPCFESQIKSMDASVTISSCKSDGKLSSKSNKCRLPQPAFSVDKEVAAAVPVKEKIANVIRKRQSMTDSNRIQGSRIPMLILPPIEEPSPPKLRSVKSVRLNVTPVEKPSTPRPKTLVRSNTMPSRVGRSEKPEDKKSIPKRPPTSQRLRNPSPRTPPPPSKTPPPPSTRKETASSKTSIYQKRLPLAETRTARLMMGVSTNGRRQSYKTREETPTTGLVPTLGYQIGRLFRKPSTNDTKKRPVSYGAPSSLSSNKPHFNNHSIPNLSTMDKQNLNKRQSIPALSKTDNRPKSNTINKKSDSSNTKESLKNSIKALRVH